MIKDVSIDKLPWEKSQSLAGDWILSVSDVPGVVFHVHLRCIHNASSMLF